MYRSPCLEIQELMALYGGERDHYCVRDEEYGLASEFSEEGKGSRGIHSLEIYGLQREQHAYFSKQEYYRRLEELESAHLMNMAELERMYISQGREWHREEDDGALGRGRNREAKYSIRSGAARKLPRINSQEELDFHESSSGSEQSELCGDDSMWELELDGPGRTPGNDRTFRRDMLLFQPKSLCSKPQGRRSGSKVTVPKPFQMMLREEERKKHKVRTRSEIELENTLLRRELEELRECQKKFRASPVPAHIHVPLYEIISRRSSQRSSQSRSSSNSCGTRRNLPSAATSPQPFHFLERETRKREAKILAELGNLGQKEERQAFKARPMPGSVYGSRRRADSKTTNHQPQSLTICTLEREATKGQRHPSCDLEPDMLQFKSNTSAGSCRAQKCPASKPAKKQMEVSIEMVKEREWSYINAPKATGSNICSPLQPGASPQ